VFFNVKFYTSALVGMIKVIHAHSASFMEPYKYDAEGYNFFLNFSVGRHVLQNNRLVVRITVLTG